MLLKHRLQSRILGGYKKGALYENEAGRKEGRKEGETKEGRKEGHGRKEGRKEGRI